MGRGKVRKGRGGRIQLGGSKGMSATPASSGKVLYCERCGTTGVHRNLREVAECWGVHKVMTGLNYRWVRGELE